MKEPEKLKNERVVTRRSFLSKATVSAAATAATAAAALTNASHAEAKGSDDAKVANQSKNVKSRDSAETRGNKVKPKVIFLDVNETTLDLKLLKKSVGNALGGKPELLPLWFSTMLHHSLVATVGDHYEDFGAIGAAALQMVASSNGTNLSKEDAVAAVKPIRQLPAHPDVKPALKRLKDAGIKIMTLTNSSNSTVNAQMKNAGLESYLEKQLSIEDIGIYKPHTHAYRWAARKVNAELNDCMLVAAHGWDVAGASWAGMRTAFISRPGQALYTLAAKPEIVVSDFGKFADTLLTD